MINCRKSKQYRILVKSITFVVITTFLCSSLAWASTELPQTNSSLQVNSTFDEHSRNDNWRRQIRRYSRLLERKEKSALIVGAGKFGRGLLGTVLHRSGYKVSFIDREDRIIGSLRERKKYQVNVCDSGGVTKTEMVDIEGAFLVDDKVGMLQSILNNDLVFFGSSR